MYKLTVDGKTMVGCNQDAWRTTTSIWFANTTANKLYAACFTGSRKVSANRFTPQSGMNTQGLVFSRLTAYHPKKNIQQENKKKIKNEADYLEGVLHNCKNIKEVKEFVSTYDRTFFYEDVFMYIDKSGNYLVVEPYELIEGNDPTYVLSNFCPSITNIQSARKITRYKNGEDYLKNHKPDTTLNYCRSVSEAMHVCRKRNGDGTLLTSIWDTKQGLVNLFFYHNYDTTVQFNISEELAKGDHQISIPEIFPVNEEFIRLKEYKTPFNQNGIRISLVLLAGFLCLLSLLLIISYFRKRNTDKFNFIKLPLAALNILLAPYLLILSTNKNIFYMDAPYVHFSSKLISLSSYIPILLVPLIIPIITYSIRYIKKNSKRMFIKGSFIVNMLVYILLIVAFGYWGLFQIF